MYYDPSGYVCEDKSRAIEITPTELSAFGNKTEPRGARPKQDFGVENFDDIVGPEQPPLPKGASTMKDVNSAPLTGNYHVIPEGTELPDGLGVISDGKDVIGSEGHAPGHHTIYPTKEMTVEEFNKLFKSLPWKYGGKK